MTRAVLEGIAFGLRDSFRLMQEAGVPAPEEVRISGGGARSPLWRQIIADVLGTELVGVGTTEGAAYGAALLAGVGADVWPSAEAACADVVETQDLVTPDLALHDQYEAAYDAYRALYPALRTSFEKLAEV